MERYIPVSEDSIILSSKVDLTAANASQSDNSQSSIENKESQAKKGRQEWDNGIEFLMSCIALSVGFGNVWRFPFIALENGGGAFLIPYLIVLFLVGKPIYYLEMVLGQFSSRGSVKVFDCAPVMRGIGYAQGILTFFIATYYSSLLGINLRYFISSFYNTLPWSYCRKEWGPNCIDSALVTGGPVAQHSEIASINGSIKKTSAEYYFVNVILHEANNIDEGIGAPDLHLALSLVVCWITIFCIVLRGIKTSGKASYVLAILPYVIMTVLLVRALTLPGAFDGILYFLKPQWDKLFDAGVWYAAVTQVFFSLTVCYGVIVMYSSHNKFNRNLQRDCAIVTTLDTATSLMSGIVIFGILGNLAHVTGSTDIKSVVKGGPGLAFISYPNAIAKFAYFPQVFSGLFFLMMLLLGVGSNVGVVSSVIGVVYNLFPNAKRWCIVTITCSTCFCFGLIYTTPGGQYMLNYIDFYGVTFVAMVVGILELISAGWIYGVKNICHDIQFMLNSKTSLYYRLCWSIVTPLFMTSILVYTLLEYEPITYNGAKYPGYFYAIGWCISAFAIGQVLVWACVELYKRPESTLCDRIKNVIKPYTNWGPLDCATFNVYKKTLENINPASLSGSEKGFWFKIYDNIFN